MPDLAKEFRLDPELAYLNHAAVAPWPERTARAVQEFAVENLRRGAQHYAKWLQVEERLKERLMRLLNAPSPDDIALVKNTSEGLSTVAYGLRWSSGENIVGIHADFPSNCVVWQSLSRYGVEFRGVDVNAAQDPEQALIAACDAKTRLLAVSSVHYASGLRLDLPRLGHFCRERKVLFCVDAIQSLAAVPFDLHANQADFVVADGHKWMLGPEGLAVFYCRPTLREELRLTQYGWHMLEHAGDYNRRDWQISQTATRFECGSPNMLGVHALEASLSLIEDVGIAAVQEALLANTDYLIEALGQFSDTTVVTPKSHARRAGIVTFLTPPNVDATRVYRRLMSAGVICAARGGGVRFSPHWYTSRTTLEKALTCYRQIIQEM